MVYPFIGRFLSTGLIPNTERKALPIGFEHPRSPQEILARLMHDPAFQKGLEDNGVETFEEADDFNVDDDPFPMPDVPFEHDHDLAYATAAHHGLAEKLTEERSFNVRDAIRNAVSKPKKPVTATTLPEAVVSASLPITKEAD